MAFGKKLNYGTMTPSKTNRISGKTNVFGGMGDYSFGQGMNESKSQPQTNKGNYSQYSPSAGSKQQGNQSGPLPSAPSGGVDMSAYRPSPAQPKTQQYTDYGFVDRPWVGPGPKPDRSQSKDTRRLRPTIQQDPDYYRPRPTRPNPGNTTRPPAIGQHPDQDPFGPGGMFFPGGPGRFAPPRTPAPPPGHVRKNDPQVRIDELKELGTWDHPQNAKARERLLKMKADYDANPFQPAHDVWQKAEPSPNMGYPGRPSPPRAPSPPSGSMPGYAFPGQPSPPSATSPLDGVRPFLPAPPQQPEPMPYPKNDPFVVQQEIGRRQNMLPQNLNLLPSMPDPSEAYNQSYQSFMDSARAIDPFGNVTTPQAMINQRDAFIARQQQEEAKLARIAGVYGPGQAPEIPNINRNYLDLWNQAGEMVEGGWTNPLLGLFNRSGRPNFRDLER